MPNLPKKRPEEEMMEQYRLWINDMMDNGYTIKDIGPDPKRATSSYPDIISPFYRMMRTEIAERGYKMVISTREGFH